MSKGWPRKEIFDQAETLATEMSGLLALARRGTVLQLTDQREPGMIEKKKAPKRGRRSPLGDRRQFLTMMSPQIIKEIKKAALEDDRAAWDVMEEAARQWLDRRKQN
jgi:hypothetical protein